MAVFGDLGGSPGMRKCSNRLFSMNIMNILNIYVIKLSFKNWWTMNVMNHHERWGFLNDAEHDLAFSGCCYDGYSRPFDLAGE